MKIPRFLRTKHGVFVSYLSLLCAAFVAFNLWLGFRVWRRVDLLDVRLQSVYDETGRKLRALASLKDGVESLLAECRGTVGGSVRSAPGSGTDSGLPEPEPEPAPIAKPQVLGIGNNGLYAYADIRDVDGQVHRHYQRLPEHLRRSARK